MTMRADVGPGVAFPDYELPDQTGRLRRLSEIQGEDPMVIVLAREAYSAKDQAQHEGLVQLWREMKPGVGYCRMVTITTAEPQEALNYRNGVGSGVAVPGRSRPDRAARPGHRRVHRPGARPDGPAHDRVRAGADRLQGLQRLLVLRAPDRRGAAPGLARGVDEAPLGLGSVGPQRQGRLGARRDRPLLPARAGLA